MFGYIASGVNELDLQLGSLVCAIPVMVADEFANKNTLKVRKFSCVDFCANT